MTFDEVLAQVQELLQREKRVSYRGLKRRFALDDEYLEDLKEELVGAKRLAADEEGRFLVWAGEEPKGEEAKGGNGEDSLESRVQSPESKGQAPIVQALDPKRQTLDAAAERRQLTVMFCDLVGSTTLSEQLDPEEYREVVRAYQETCSSVVRRYDGYLAQHLGDGLLVYFGYPAAHEDEAQRAVRTGLEIVTALQTRRLSPRSAQPLQVRIGIHTGLVVIGEIGSGEKREMLALGETPNIAARVQGLAEPDTVIMSAVTQRLVHGLFECQDLGLQTLKGTSTPLSLYRVIGESAAQSRFEVAVGAGLTPLVGREEELGLLQRRWEQAKDGAGQVVLLSGEAGIGKSRLMQTLKEQVLAEGATRIEFRCSPYHQNSAFYPIIDHLQRLLQFAQDDTPQVKLAKLQQALVAYRFPQADTLPLFAALLSLPQPESMPPLTLSPQKQKQKTQEALVAWIIEEAQEAAVYCAWEDLHWIDPSSLEVLTLFLEQIPTARVFSVLTFRPEFTPPWSPRSYLTPLTLNRLGRPHVEVMVAKVTGDKALPLEVLQQIVSKTDGVPLFVEELTKMVLESGLLREEDGHYVGVDGGTPIPPLAIPSTLQDSLMARLDRLAPIREIAQVGAVLGREFSYELLQAVSSMDEALLQEGLRQLVEAELVYQRGVPPQATYLFKHALIQDTAYQSLLKSKRQQLHQQIAQVLEAQFTDIKETQPELVAHHYTEASLIPQSIAYWQRAGQRAIERSAHVEAIGHLTKALELLKTLPDIPERTQQELTLQITLGVPLMATEGFASPEVGRVYNRARELCEQVGESSQLFPVLWGLWAFYGVLAEWQTALDLGERLLDLAQRQQAPPLLLQAHYAVGVALCEMGKFIPARMHLEQSIALYNPQQHRSHAFLYGFDPGVASLSFTAWTLWCLGYPDHALKRAHEALTLAQEISHPFSLGMALNWTAEFHQFRREVQAVQERAEAAIILSTEQGFLQWLAFGTGMRGWALAEQGRREEGIAQIRQGLATHQASGAKVSLPYWLALLAEAYRKGEQAEEGLTILTETLAQADKTGERFYEADLYRLKGELTLQSKVQGLKSKVTDSPAFEVRSPEAEAEEYFLQALEISRKQQAKSLELRATVSLARLWQQQSKQKEAHQMLFEIYNWFTEGFDTKDLQEAKALLQELA